MHTLKPLLALAALLVLVIATISGDRAVRTRTAERLLDTTLASHLDDPCYRHRVSHPPPTSTPGLPAGLFDAGAPAVYSGILTHAYEEGSFRPCGSLERWWVEIDPCTRHEEKFARFGSRRVPVEDPPRRYFATLEGVLVQCGHCGHLGQYEQRLRVTEFLGIRRATPDDCQE